MKIKTLSILSILALVLSLPAMAQEPQPQDPATELEVEASVDTQSEELAAEGTPQETESASPAEAGEETESAEMSEEERALPQTASPLPLLALLGLTGAGTALGVRYARRK